MAAAFNGTTVCLLLLYFPSLANTPYIQTHTHLLSILNLNDIIRKYSLWNPALPRRFDRSPLCCTLCALYYSWTCGLLVIVTSKTFDFEALCYSWTTSKIPSCQPTSCQFKSHSNTHDLKFAGYDLELLKFNLSIFNNKLLSHSPDFKTFSAFILRQVPGFMIQENLQKVSRMYTDFYQFCLDYSLFLYLKQFFKFSS